MYSARVTERTLPVGYLSTFSYHDLSAASFTISFIVTFVHIDYTWKSNGLKISSWSSAAGANFSIICLAEHFVLDSGMTDSHLFIFCRTLS